MSPTRGQSAPARPGDAPARRPDLAAGARLAPLAAEPARRGGPVAVIDRGSPCAFRCAPVCPRPLSSHLRAGRIWPRGAALSGPRHGGWPGGDVRRGLDSVRDCNVTAGAWAPGGRNRGNTSADVGRPSRFGLGRILPLPGRRVGGGHGGRTVRPVGRRRVGRFGASAGPPGSAPRPVLVATVAVGPPSTSHRAQPRR